MGHSEDYSTFTFETRLSQPPYAGNGGAEVGAMDNHTAAVLFKWTSFSKELPTYGTECRTVWPQYQQGDYPNG